MGFAPRFTWIRVAAILSPAAVAGCALPLGFTAATYGIDGVTYVTEGKSTTDMAISGVQGENCALWRIVQGKPVCKPYTAAEEAQLAQNRADVKRGHPEVVLMSEETNFAQVTAPVEAKLPVGDVNATEVAAADPKSSDGAEAAPPAVPVASVTAQNLAAAPGPDGARTMSGDARATEAVARSSARTSPRAHSGDVYLVLGSFSTRDKAERARDLYAKSGSGLTFAVLDGPALHRVASGPLAPNEVAAARTRIAGSLGIKKPWAIPACGAAGGAGCATMARLGIDTTQLASAAN